MLSSAHPHPRLRGLCVGSAAAAAALAVAAAALIAPAAGSAAPAKPACRTSQLVVWLNGENGTAGTTFYTLNFTNLGNGACTLRGYPGVSALGLNGRQLGSAASRTNGTKVKTVTLQGVTSNGNDTATATLGIVEAGNFPAARCRPTAGAALRVFPPNQTASRTVPLPFGACARSGTRYLTVRAIH
jgi:hypothetical protein